MERIKSPWICFLMILMSFGCKMEDEICRLDEEILKMNIPFEIIRLEDEFFESDSKEDFLYLLEKYPEFSEKFFLAPVYNSKEELAEELLALHQDSLMRELYQEVKKNFSDITELETDLLNAFKYISHYFPDFKAPKIYTFVNGFSSDLYIDEDMLVIGLDYYLPFEHKFQPPDLPQYISRRYQKEYIVPMVVMAFSSRYNNTDLSQSTLLAEMIYFGKTYHFTKSILPCTPDELIIGYSGEEVAACFANEEYIWSYFIENDLFFETNPFIIRKYTGESPATDEISPEAPGRIGRWLGWNIVDDYRINNQINLPEMMKESDTNRIFRRSGYKPRS